MSILKQLSIFLRKIPLELVVGGSIPTINLLGPNKHFKTTYSILSLNQSLSCPLGLFNFTANFISLQRQRRQEKRGKITDGMWVRFWLMEEILKDPS